MTNKTVTMPRDLVERLIRNLENMGMVDMPGELRALLAAPIVEAAETIFGHHPSCQAVDDYNPGDCRHACKSIIEADGIGEAAGSIAQMVTEWVETGIKLNTDWRNGLSRIIQKRLARFPASPESVDLSKLRDYHAKAIENLKS